MTSQLKVRKIGNSLGLIVPKELSDLMHVKEGDTVTAADTSSPTKAPGATGPPTTSG